jgi:hypothetical protein
VQTFYQPLFSNSPLAISLQQFFSLPKASYTKKPKAQSKKPSHQKAKVLSKKQNPPKQKPRAKALHPPSASLFYPVVNRVEQQFLGRGVTSCFSECKQLRNICSVFPSSMAGAVPILAYR